MLTEVLAVNRQAHLAAIRTGEGITVFSWDCAVQLFAGDMLQGQLEGVEGKFNCFNTSVGTELNVWVVAARCSEDSAIKLLFS